MNSKKILEPIQVSEIIFLVVFQSHPGRETVSANLPEYSQDKYAWQRYHPQLTLTEDARC